MEYLNIELDEYRKIPKGGRIFNIIFGFGTIFLSTLAIYRRITGGHGFWEYFVFVLFIVLGVNVILYTFGIFYRISRRYVIVDEQGIEYKLSYFYPSRNISWASIKKVDIKTLRIFFVTKGGSSYRMKLGEIFYNDIKKLKKTLASICNQKGIEWSDTTVESGLADKNWP